MTTFVQKASVTWLGLTQGSAKTITLPGSAAVGNVVIIEISYQDSAISSVSGLGATWTMIRSREGSSSHFPSAEIWYGTVATAGTTITVTPNSGFAISAGKAVAREFNGLNGSVASSSTTSAQTSTATRACPSQSATAGQVYIGVATQDTGTAATSLTQSPGSFGDTENVVNSGSSGGATNDSCMVSGYRIAAGSETIQLTGNFAAAHNGIAVAAVFDFTTSANVTLPVAVISTASPSLAPSVPVTVALPVATISVASPALAAGALAVVNLPAATITTASPALTAAARSEFHAYSLDDNASQALNIPLGMSAVLETDVLPLVPSGFVEAKIRARRLSLVMPTPTLDSRGRPS